MKCLISCHGMIKLLGNTMLVRAFLCLHLLPPRQKCCPCQAFELVVDRAVSFLDDSPNGAGIASQDWWKGWNLSPQEISFHSPSFWVLCKHLLIISNGFPKAIFTQVCILIISTLCFCHCSPPLLLIPIFLLKFPSSFGVQFLFLCFGDSTSLIRVTYRIMGDGLFTGAWATYLWQHHREKFLFLSQQP